MKNWIGLIGLFLIIISCNTDSETVLERGHLRLEYPLAKYDSFQEKAPYTFEKSIYTIVKEDKNKFWFRLKYPQLKSTIYLSYYPIENNLNKLLKDVEKLTYKHTAKANSIEVLPYENSNKKVYGQIKRVGGESASNIQFHVTDSAKHLVAGSLYFYTSPQPDSLRPAVQYLEKDIKHILETFEWIN